MSMTGGGRADFSGMAWATGGRGRSARLATSCLVVAIVLPLVLFSQPAQAAGLPTYYSTTDTGYSVYSTTTPPARVSTQFRVPTVSGCTGKDRQIAVGVLAQDSTGAGSSAFVNIGCHAGKPEYKAVVNMFGALTMLSATISPDDLISLTSTMTPSSSTATIRDRTTGFADTVTGIGDTAAYGSIVAGPVHEPPLTGTLLGVPEFTRISFSKATINGIDLGAYTAAGGLYEFIRTTNGSAPPSGTIQVQLGALGTASFSLVFLHH